MGVIREQARWVDDLYRIQISDPILGGSDGIINVQPSQLANRTAFLKALVALEHCETGHHNITDAMISELAGLASDKLSLDIPLENIRKALDVSSKEATALRDELVGLIGDDGLLIEGLTKVVQLNWRYSDFGFEFEFFIDTLTMRDMKNLDARGAIAYDDSVDCVDTSGFAPGMRMLITDGVKSEEIEIWKVLEQGRLRLTHDLANTYGENTTVGYTDWQLEEGQAIASRGKVYYSKITSVLENAPVGRLVIRRDGNAGKLRVEYRDSMGTAGWIPVDADEVTYDGEQWFDEHYTLEGGNIQLRITGLDGPVVVKRMALFPMPTKQIVSSIKTPALLEPDAGEDVARDMLKLESSAFRAAYKDKYVCTEYALQEQGSGSIVFTVTTDVQAPITGIDEDTLPANGLYNVLCRHQSDIGEWSSWSRPVPINLKPIQFYFAFLDTLRGTGFGKDAFFSLQTEEVRFGFLGAADSAGFESALFTTKLED